MAKTMAVIDQNNIVINIISCAEWAQETDTNKETFEYPASIGDTWQDGLYYRNGERVLSLIEEYCLVDAERRELLNDMAQMVEEIYEMDLEIMS